jgi:hypothetical protein
VKTTLPCWSCYQPIAVPKARLAELLQIHELPLCSECARMKNYLILPSLEELDIHDLLNLSEQEAKSILAER